MFSPFTLTINSIDLYLDKLNEMQKDRYGKQYILLASFLLYYFPITHDLCQIK